MRRLFPLTLLLGALAFPAGAEANHHACPVLRLQDGDSLSWSRHNCVPQHVPHPVGGPKSPVPSSASIPIADLPGNVLIVTPEVPDLGANGDVFPAMDPLMDVSPSLACFRPNLGSDPDNPGDPPTGGPEPDNDADDDGIPVEGLGHGLDADNVICSPDKKIVPNLAGLGLQPVPLTPELLELGATQLPLTADVQVGVNAGPVKAKVGLGF